MISDQSELKECSKGMSPNACPYNPILGCDCGFHPAHKSLSEKDVEDLRSLMSVFGEGKVTAKEIMRTDFPRLKRIENEEQVRSNNTKEASEK